MLISEQKERSGLGVYGGDVCVREGIGGEERGETGREEK